MKTFIAIILTITFIIPLYSQKKDDKEFKWSEKEKTEKVKNLQDPTKWDMELLSSDLKQTTPKLSSDNMNFGIFPVPKYKQGLGTGQGADRKYYGKILYWNFFIAEKNNVNQSYVKDKEDEVFFTIICLTDILDFSNENYNTASSVNSRNYPDKLGTGVIKTKNNSIEYLAFSTGDRKQFALVNQRIFDLDQGQIILIAPQKDGSLRSLQIKSPLLESKEIIDYIKDTIQKEDVKDFFLDKNNI